jgi:hypothetical protein
MTKAFCHIILHYSIANLSWKTVKSLRRSRKLERKHDDDDDDSVPLSIKQKNDGREKNVTRDDYEILKGWTIIAFHSLYVSTGIEVFFRVVVPFYFHLKMIVLIATFVIPSWTVTSHGTSGLSPIVSYWFDYLIVPGVHRVHACMGHDPKKWAKQQMAMLPLRFIDWLILPGVLATDEEKQLVRKKRSMDSNASDGVVTMLVISSKTSPDQPLDPAPALEVPPVEAHAHSASNSIFSPEQSHGKEIILFDQSLQRGNNDYHQSANVDSANVDSVAGASRTREGGKGRFATKQSVASQNTHTTPQRILRDSTLFNEITPNKEPKTLFPRTTPPLSIEHSKFSVSPTSSRKSSFRNSILSPAAKSRLESSALRLRRISQEHRLHNGLSPHASSSKGYASPDDGDIGTMKLRAATGAVINETQSSTLNARRKRAERLSLGDHFRELVTGDANVRVRDHLFDLDLPISPRRHLQEERRKNNVRSSAMRDIDTVHITTRRSSRLAKKIG